jgi:hypothetical protein
MVWSFSGTVLSTRAGSSKKKNAERGRLSTLKQFRL